MLLGVAATYVMVKAYLRYELSNTFGVINSNANVVYDYSGKLVVSAALENINVWNVRQGVLVRFMSTEHARGSLDRAFLGLH